MFKTGDIIQFKEDAYYDASIWDGDSGYGTRPIHRVQQNDIMFIVKFDKDDEYLHVVLGNVCGFLNSAWIKSLKKLNK